MKSFKIGKKIIGSSGPFFIAEAGVNHNGSLKLALKLVDMAKSAGADAIKFETFKAGQVTLKNTPMADYQRMNIGRSGSQFSMLEKLELEEKFYPEIIDYCKKKDIIFLSTPHGGFESVDFLQSHGVPVFKFGSGDLTNLPVLRYAALLRKPIILSTGMATMNEVKEAVECIKKTGNSNISLLHCTSDYPCREEDVNLKAMLSLREKFDLPVGYSDHTLGSEAAIMAATLGACIIEKHITLDRNMSGPDHKASMEFKELLYTIKAIKNVNIILGSSLKRPTKRELNTRNIARKSLVALKDISSGDIFSIENAGIKRPGIGLKPKYFFKILGLRSKKDIKADTLIKKNDF